MHESTLDLFCERAEADADAFWAFIEDAADDVNVSPDYYFEEFYLD
jgi:hypothetical protein